MTIHFHPNPPQHAVALLRNLLLLGTNVTGDSDITGLLLIS